MQKKQTALNNAYISQQYEINAYYNYKRTYNPDFFEKK